MADLQCQYYLVAFLDLMGQSGKLSRITDIPEQGKPGEMEEFVSALKETAGTVLAVRASFERFFEGYRATERSRSIRGVPAEVAELLDFGESQVVVRGISDSIVMQVPLGGDRDQWRQINDVWAGIYCVTTMFVVHLASGVPIRGGMELGVCVEFDGGEIYGRAVSDAAHLEAKVADYPRIVVGERLCEYLNSCACHEGKSDRAKLVREMARQCLRLVSEDSDGLPVLDYMSERARDSVRFDPGEDLAGNADFRRVIDRAYGYAKRQHAAFACGKTERDQAIAHKYKRLVDFMRPRLGRWE